MRKSFAWRLELLIGGVKSARPRAAPVIRKDGPMSSMIANFLKRGFEDFGAVLQTGLLFV